MIFSIISGATADPVTRGKTVQLRFPHASDYAAWARLRAASSEFLQPWEPRWPSDDLSRDSYRKRLKRYNQEIKAQTGFPFFIERRSDKTLLGGISLGHVRRGVSQSGQIGYWIGKDFAGQGHMREGLELLCNFAFSSLNLHRLEAACVPSNERSIGLLEKAGFEREGHLRSYLKINGNWQDHILYSRINPFHGADFGSRTDKRDA